MNNLFYDKINFDDKLIIKNNGVIGNNDLYFLKYKNDTAGILIYNIINDKFSFKKNKNYKGMNPFPITNIFKNLDSDKWDEFIRIWIEERVIQECRPEVSSILKEFKLGYYDVWDICRSNLAMSVEDFFWITKDNTLRYEDFNIRYCTLNNITPVYKPPFPIVRYPSYFEREKIKSGEPWKYELKNTNS
ncbi:TPA: hypothetical protein KQG32_003069 [Clostridioides difficile]|nr:hypothetical protein [Clostridioides difficile]